MIAMEALQGYLSEEHKKVVEEFFGTVNDKLCRLQEDASKFVFPSTVSGKNKFSTCCRTYNVILRSIFHQQNGCSTKLEMQ